SYPQPAHQTGDRVHQNGPGTGLQAGGGARVTSIRSRLLTILIASTGLVWLLAVAWIYLSTQAEVERVLDARLTEAARMVNSLLAEQRIELALAADGDLPATEFQIEDPSYER